MHRSFKASIGLSEGLKKLSKFANIESAVLSECLLGIIIDVISDPTSQIERAFNKANKNEAKMDIKTIIL